MSTTEKMQRNAKKYRLVISDLVAGAAMRLPQFLKKDGT